jgi:hypothetical protein
LGFYGLLIVPFNTWEIFNLHASFLGQVVFFVAKLHQSKPPKYAPISHRDMFSLPHKQRRKNFPSCKSRKDPHLQVIAGRKYRAHQALVG